MKKIENLLSYLEEKEYNIEESVYEIHDKLSIMYLPNFFENCYDIDEINYEEYTDCETYKDFMLLIYKKVLTSNATNQFI